MQRAIAAISQQGEIFRLVTEGAQFRGHAVGHVRIDGALDQLAGLDHVDIEIVGELVLDGLA